MSPSATTPPLRRKPAGGSNRAPRRRPTATPEAEHYRNIAELVADYAHCVRVEPDGGMSKLWVGDGFKDLTGYDINKWEVADRYRLIHPDDHSVYDAHEARVLSGQADACEVRIITKTGEVRWIRMYRRPVWSEAEKRVVRFYGAAQDITSCKLAEVDLQRTSETLRALISAAPLAILVLDRSGNVTLWNPAAERMFGWSAGEVVGGPPPFVPDDQREEYRALIEAELRGQTHLGLERHRRRQDGEAIEVSLSTAPLVDEQGAVIGTIRMLTDITDRVRAEEQRLRDAERLQLLSRRLIDVQETERRTLARELHDEVGQVMTGFRLALESSLRSANPEAGPHLARALSLANDLIERIRNLALDLRPAVLDDLGLVPALSTLFERYTGHTQVRVRFKEFGVPRRFGAAVETTAYRVVQEALTNVARHAQVGEAIVRLRREAGRVVIEVEDHGAGFDVALALAAGAGSGLVGMRERAEAVSGHLTIDSAPGSGTRVLLEISEAAEREHNQ